MADSLGFFGAKVSSQQPNPALPVGTFENLGDRVMILLQFPVPMVQNGLLGENEFLVYNDGGVNENWISTGWVSSTVFQLILENPGIIAPCELDYFFITNRLTTLSGYQYPAWTGMSIAEA